MNISGGLHSWRCGALWGAILCGALSLSGSPALAGCVSSANVYCDNTVVQAYNGGSKNNYGGPGFSPPGVGDVLEDPGHGFDTDRVNATVTSAAGTTSLELKYYTQFDGNDQTASYADIFIGNKPNSPDSFQYGISLGDETSNGGAATPGLYSLAPPNSDETSIQLWTGKTSYIYGGQYLGLDGQWHDAPTVVTAQADLLNAWTVNVSELSSGEPQFPYLVDVTLTGSTQDFDAFFGDGLSVFWGTGDCSNDAIEAAIPVKLPEPMTLGLFGAGLAGAAAIRRRKNKKTL
jgi:hypothetical protein